MIPLIQGISDSDAERYYHNVVVFFEGAPHKFLNKAGDDAAVSDANGIAKRVPYSELRTTVVRPFFAESGEYLGHTAHRRTSRGIEYPRNTFSDIQLMVTVGDVPRIKNGIIERLNKDWCLIQYRHLNILYYRTDPVGFLRKDTIHVTCPLIADRLQKLISEKAYEFLVQLTGTE